MRRIISGVVLALTVAGGACVDLEEKLVSNLSSEYVKTAAGLNDATNAIYTRLRGYYGREQMMAMSDMGTDAITNGDQVVAGGAQPWVYFADYNTQFNGSDARVGATWNNFYIMVANANVVLTYGPAVPVGGVLTQADKDSRLGESHFLRALAHFELVRFFGDITLNLEATSGITTEAARAPESEVYESIISDLEAAIQLLPVNQAQWGRARRGAAEHLLAKVYLTRAYRPWNAANKNADFQQAQDLATTLINSGTYSLVPVYADLFCGQVRDSVNLRQKDPLRQGYCNTVSGSNFSEQNNEILFSVQYTRTAADYLAAWCGNNTDCANYIHLTYLARYDNDNVIGVGLGRDLNNGRPFRRVRTTPYAFSVFDQTRWSGVPGQSDIMDTRFDGTFQTLWFATGNNANGNTAAGNAVWTGVCPNCTSGAPIAIGDTALWMPGYQVSDAFRQSKKFSIYVPCPEADPTSANCGDFGTQQKTNKTRRIYGWETGPSVKKYQDNTRADAFDQAGGKDVILMRLGETYLIAAEAALGLGNTGLAAQMINALRARAASANYKNDPRMMVSSGQITLDFIMDERIRELHAEGMRWQDLVRPGTQFFVDRVSRTNPEARANVQGFHALRPIPQAQINGVTGNPYPQNPGY